MQKQQPKYNIKSRSQISLLALGALLLSHAVFAQNKVVVIPLIGDDTLYIVIQ